MKKATVTYSAPPGDSKVVEMMGYTFFDGKATEVVCDDFQIEKLEGNKHFKVSGVQDHDEQAAAEKASKEAKDKEASKEEGHSGGTPKPDHPKETGKR